MRERNVGINIRVTPEEKDKMSANAKKCGLTLSEYLRQLATEHDPKELPKKEIYEEMIGLDHKLSEIRSIFDESVQPHLKARYDDRIQQVRQSLMAIWKLLMSNLK